MIASEYRALARQQRNNWWLLAKRMFLTTLLSRFVPPGAKRNLLDIGCGTGINFEVYRRFGSITAIDTSPLALQYAKKYHYAIIRRASAMKLPATSGSFDVVTIIDVLYHKSITDDRTALKEIYRVLKHNGILVLVDCVHPFLYGPHDVNNLARERYTKQELERKIIAAGLTILHSTYLYASTFPFFVMQRLFQKYMTKKEGNSFEGETPLMNSIFMTMCRLENQLLRRTSLPWGSSIAFVCTKTSLK